ncbi:DUF935 domain-containing protein [Rhizobium sp. C1]|uniref:DUF935 domain-containing protein n=1 Tax=Rhizobium sp. C1 TaxID=1349799 RepID=UPI001E4CC443|nr:DUF935 domain-containing protein [Rhizobium sp. C1]MCD2176454.1 DUF935 domain-containing protein [Rhizobium sp. C1]
MAGLRDFLNIIRNPKELLEKIAAGRVGTTRDPHSPSPANGMTPVRLARILDAAAHGDPLAYYELAEDMEERDPHYLAVLNTRKRSVAQLPITVNSASDDPAHKKHAEFIQAWIKGGVLRSGLYDMLDAIGKGFSVMEVDWQTTPEGWMPRCLDWRSQRFFDFDREDGETVMLRDLGQLVPLAPHKFIVHRSKAKSGLTVRSGLARIVAWSWMFKHFTVRDWAIFVQNYGQPIRIGKYDNNATEEQKDILWKAVSRIAGDCAAILPKSMEIEFQEIGSKSASTDMFERRADWFDKQVSKAVLGQTTTTDAISGGHAVSQEHRQVQQDIERSDALDVSDTLNQQLIPNLIAFNFGPQDKYPTVSVGRPDEPPLKEFADAFARLAPQGLTAPASHIRQRMGIPAPQEGEEIIGGKMMGPRGGQVGGQDPGNDPTPAKQAMDRLFASAHSSRRLALPADPVEELTARLEQDAAAALDEQIDTVRAIFEKADSLEDAARQLADLDLDPEAMAKAMASGMVLAHLAGQAALVDALGSTDD